MPKARVEEGSEYFFEEGTFQARMILCKEEHVDFIYKSTHKAVLKGTAKVGEKSSFDKWNWTWELLEGPQRGQTITVDTDPGVSLKGTSLARELYTALLGRDVELDEDIDTDKVEGLRAQIVLTHVEPEPRRDGTGFYYNTRVTDAFSMKPGEDAPSYDDPPF